MKSSTAFSVNRRQFSDRLSELLELGYHCLHVVDGFGQGPLGLTQLVEVILIAVLFGSRTRCSGAPKLRAMPSRVRYGSHRPFDFLRSSSFLQGCSRRSCIQLCCGWMSVPSLLSAVVLLTLAPRNLMYKHTTNTLGANSEGNLVLGSAGGMQTSVLGPTDITIYMPAFNAFSLV